MRFFAPGRTSHRDEQIAVRPYAQNDSSPDLAAYHMRLFWVYIVASRTRTLYVGVTNNLRRRISEHKQKLVPGFTRRYNVTRLVYYVQFADIRLAIAREKQIKGWLRRRKLALIETQNPNWNDLVPRVLISSEAQQARAVILSEAKDLNLESGTRRG